MRTLHRDNAALNQKVKGLLTELEEIRAQREQAGLQSDHVTRLQSRQLTEHMANIKALEVIIIYWKKINKLGGDTFTVHLEVPISFS